MFNRLKLLRASLCDLHANPGCLENLMKSARRGALTWRDRRRRQILPGINHAASLAADNRA
jgi:hypothetical protein